jgi:GTPase SAR1 family protein
MQAISNQDSKKADYEFKVVLVGDGATGKTSCKIIFFF